MTQTLYMLKGLPASGKSTWARELINNKENIKRVNRDDIRSMLGTSEWSKKSESIVNKIRKGIIITLLEAGFSVIDDNTNLHPKNERWLRTTAEEREIEFKIISFTDVSLKLCIIRDTKRKRSVGIGIITTMYKQYIDPGKL